MKWVGLAIILVIIVIYFTSVQIRMSYVRQKEDDRIQLMIRLWGGLLTFKYEIPALKLDSIIEGVQVKRTHKKDKKAKKKSFSIHPNDIHALFQRVFAMQSKIHDFNGMAKDIGKQMKCHRFDWDTEVGTGDAATTGMLVGALWGIKSMLAGFFSTYITMNIEPELNVTPVFQGRGIHTTFCCIIHFQMGQIMLTVTRILFKLIKGRGKSWQNTLYKA